MDSVLIVSSTSKGQKYFSDFLNAHEFNRIGIAASGGEARRILLEMPYDLVVINAPLRDEFGHELAIDLSNTTSAGVLMVVKSELAELKTFILSARSMLKSWLSSKNYRT